MRNDKIPDQMIKIFGANIVSSREFGRIIGKSFYKYALLAASCAKCSTSLASRRGLPWPRRAGPPALRKSMPAPCRARWKTMVPCASSALWLTRFVSPASVKRLRSEASFGAR